MHLLTPALHLHAQALEDLYTHYDNTVRNAAGGIVQFVYGDDCMDPVTMESASGKPLDFNRLLMKVGGRKTRLGCAIIRVSGVWGS